MTDNLHKWLSFHIHFNWADHSFLTAYLPKLIDELKNENLIRRFFFIRYGEGGYHIRLRLMPSAFGLDKAIEAKIRLALGQMKAELPQKDSSEVRLILSRYDRTEHYFGETLETVYSELINEQTSLLSLRFLPFIYDSRGLYTLKVIPSLYLLFANSSDGEADFQKNVAEGIDFVINSGFYHASDDDLSDQPSLSQIAAACSAIERTSKKYRELPEIVRTVKLLRRCRKIPNGHFTATHSVHLYCNKLDFSMNQEIKLYRLLQKIPADL